MTRRGGGGEADEEGSKTTASTSTANGLGECLSRRRSPTLLLRKSRNAPWPRWSCLSSGGDWEDEAADWLASAGAGGGGEEEEGGGRCCAVWCCSWWW